MNEWITKRLIVLVKILGRLLALVVLISALVFAAGSAQALFSANWQTTEAFYDLIYRVLLLVIGLELVRMLVVHDLAAVLELLAFAIARKMLKPDLEAIDVVLAVSAFVALLAARRYLLAPLTTKTDKSQPEQPGWLKFTDGTNS
jgi:hypothetical protein